MEEYYPHCRWILKRIFSTEKECNQYCKGISSILWRMFSIVEGFHQYNWWNDAIRTVEDIAEEYYPHSEGIPSGILGDKSMWRIFNIVEGNHKQGRDDT